MDTDLVLLQCRSITSRSNAEDVLGVLQQIKAVARRAKEVQERGELAVMEWIEENGDLEMENIRWYVGTVKKRKPKDRLAVAEALINAVGGDLEQFMDAIGGSDPFKITALRQHLGDSADDLYDVELVTDLKTGKPKRKVVELDTRWTK